MALSVAVALAQIGEFSFILASLGKELGVIADRYATNTLVAVSIVSIVINPLLVSCRSSHRPLDVAGTAGCGGS